MTNDGRDLRVAKTMAALTSAYDAGSPVAVPDEEYAIQWVRRYDSFERRDRRSQHSERQRRIVDMAKGMADRYEGGYKNAGPLIIDYQFVAGQICDTICFILPEGGTGLIAGGTYDESTRQRGMEALHADARSARMKVVDVPADGSSRTFTVFELVGRQPLWVLMHSVVAVLSFTCEQPIGFPWGKMTSFVDPGIRLARTISSDWRVLGVEQAHAKLTPAHLVDLGNHADIETFRPENVGQALFNAFD